MNKTALIIRHEFLQTIKRKGYIIMTLIVPLGALLGIGIFQLISGIAAPPVEEVTSIGYVDQAGGFNDHTNQGMIELIPFATSDEATTALIDRDITEYFVIPEDYIVTGVINRYTLEKQLETPAATTTIIKNFLTSNLLEDKVPSETVARIESPLYIMVTRLTETGEVATEQGGFGNFFIPVVFSFLLAFSALFSSSYLLQGLTEEKENRLIEILLSSVNARQLLNGKVLGIGAGGLVQVAIWVFSIPRLVSLASSSIGGLLSSIQIPTNFLILAVVYFILGYLLFAVISAGIGAISSSSREGQQLVGVLTVPAFIPLWTMSALIFFPESPAWVVLTIFPLTAPVEVIVRMGVSAIPIWQIATSITVLALTVIGGLFLTTRIFQTYLLMYGKRPSIREIMRSLWSR